MSRSKQRYDDAFMHEGGHVMLSLSLDLFFLSSNSGCLACERGVDRHWDRNSKSSSFHCLWFTSDADTVILSIARTGARFSAKSRSLEHKSSAPSVYRIPREAHVNPYEMQFSYVIHKAP